MAEDILDELLNEPNGSKDRKGTTQGFDEEQKKLEPLMDEINIIQDQAIRFFVRSVLLKANSFWVAPSSIAGKYHPPDEHEPGGNVLHTKRVVRIVEMICQAQDRSAFETDILVAAALIHDVTKAVQWEDKMSYDPMHPYTVDKFVEECLLEDSHHADNANRSTTLYLDEETLGQILRLVRCHLGLWSPVPETYPVTGLDWTIHLADYLASKLHLIVDGADYDVRRWILDDPDEPKGS